MDPRRFDDLAVTMAGGGRSRRAALRALGAALLGAAGAAGLGDAAAKGCLGKGKRCHKHGQCCSGKCRQETCAPCPNGEKACGRGCVRIADDSRHCGGCGNQCVEGQTCIDGACTCTAASCSSGCCDGATCQPGNRDDSCGVGGQTCQACADDEQCTRGDCVPRPCGAGGPCLVFVTSSSHNGNLGGLDAADAICQARADEASLSGTFMAWLSDGSESPDTRFPTKSAKPYRLVNGTTIANDWADLTSGDIGARIDVTETGSTGVVAGVWTHTLTSGSAGGTGNVSCSNWASTSGNGDYGYTGFSDAKWTNRGQTVCGSGNALRLYCFQQN
jgi:hypothetical protein